jgi:hypothetical protein
MTMTEIESMLRATLAKYVGKKVTPELRQQIVADLLAIAIPPLSESDEEKPAAYAHKKGNVVGEKKR